MLYNLAQAVLGAETAAGESAAVAALGFASSPTNQQILNAAKKAYTQYQSAVDATTLALVNLINTGSQRATITRLDALNWVSPGISPAVADPIFACQDVQGAIGVARAQHDLSSLSVGVYANSIPGGGVGTVGFDRDLAGTTARGLALTLDLYKNVVSTDLGTNLQLGIWLGAAGTLHDAVIGLFVSVDVQGVAINLKTLLSPALSPYGFVVSAGATVNLPVTSAVFAGATATWA